MTIVVSFEDFTPPARYDSVPWADALVEEGATSLGAWTTIDTIALSPLDPDPTAPASRSFTTSNGTAANLWYRVTFVDGSGGKTEPTQAIRNSTSAVYTTVAELARILKLRTPSDAQTEAMERVIATAAGEINAEIDLAVGTALEEWQLQLCASVNLDRAADLWRHTESIPGVAGVLDDALSLPPMRYSWERYAQRLAPLKDQWGLA